MPKQFISTGELDSHVIVPITKQLVHRLIEEMGYGNIFEDRIYFRNEFMTDSIHAEDNGDAYLTDNRVDVEINPVLNPTAVKWAPYQSNYRMGAGWSPYDFNSSPIFYSRSCNTLVREALIPCTIQMDIKFVLMSRANAYDLINRLYTKYATGEMIVVSDIVYEYKMPDNVSSLLYYMYRNLMPADTQDVAAYKSNFVPWLKSHSNNKIMLVHNRHVQNRKELAVRKNGWQLIGQLDFSQDKPEAEKSNNSALTYTVSLQYTMQFNRPAAMITDFPVVVNNNLVDDVYLSLERKEAHERYPFPINKEMKAYKDSLKPVPDAYLELIRLPWYDDWKVPSHAGMRNFKYIPFLSQVFTLDDVDNPEGVTVIDLKDGFDRYELRDHILEELNELGNDALYPWGNLMVQVYANDMLVDQSMLEFENNVLTIKNRDIKKLYHLILSKREVDDGINKTKRVWITDIICKREPRDETRGDTRREVRRRSFVRRGCRPKVVL